MAAALLILAFPLVVGAGFGLLHLARQQFGTSTLGGGHQDLIVYAGMLVVPLLAVWGVLASSGLSVAELGVRWPRLPMVGTVGSTLLSIAAGIGVAGGGYWAEKALQQTAQGASPVSSDRTDVEYLMDGASETDEAEEDTRRETRADVGNGSVGTMERRAKQYAEQGADDRVRQGQALFVLGANGFTAVAEEVLWRGYLLAYARTFPPVSLGWGLFVSAIAFGVNHFYFGWRSVASKSFLGLVWGGLFLATGSLLPAVVSHLAFNALALDVRLTPTS